MTFWVKLILCVPCLHIIYSAYTMDLEKAWIDLPSERYCQMLPKEISEQISYYHTLSKISFDSISKRISVLNKIAIELLHCSQHSQDTERIGQIAMKKSAYLLKIQDLYSKAKLLKSKLVECFVIEDKRILCLVNEILFDAKLPTYWGLYWLESIDPCHRLHLTPYYLKWVVQTDKRTPFFLWLEDQEIPYFMTQVKILSKIQLEKQEVICNGEGKLMFNNDEKSVCTTSTSGENLYVFTKDKKLFIISGNDNIRHTSLSGGAPVILAGSICVHDGTISYLSGESGHYQPDISQLWYGIKLMQSQGITFSADAIIEYYADNKKNKCDISTFLKLSPDIATERPKKYLVDFEL